MATPIKPTKFENIAASISYTFPLVDYEFDDDLPVKTAPAMASGLDFAFDRYRAGLAPVGIRRITMRATILEASPAAVDTELAEFVSEHRRIGLGKLWREGADGHLEWAYARCLGVRQRMRTMDLQIRAMSWAYEVYSDWYDDTQATDTETVTASGQTWTVNNPGNLPAYIMTIRLRANAAGGITNPKLTNQTNGWTFETARDSASADDEVKIDTGEGTVDYSDDDGGTYTDDFANVVLPSTHPPAIFRLEPGDNTIEYTGGGTPNLDVEFAFDPPMA